MMSFLLGIDVAYFYLGGSKLQQVSMRNADEKVMKWLKNQSVSNLKVSNFTIAAILASIYNSNLTKTQKDTYEKIYKADAIKVLGNNLLRVGDDVLYEWSKFRYDQATGDQPLNEVEAINVALCRIFGMTYVARKTPTLELVLPDQIFTPWE